MSLPTLSTLNTTQDTNKQLAIIRSYLIQLKDELEAELSNVTYDMLSASLQKRIDAISEDITVQKEEQFISAQMITADYAKLGTMVADNLTVAKAYADSVVANKVTASEVNSIIGNYGFLTAEAAELTYVTSKQVDAQIGRYGFITASYLSADHVYGNITAPGITATNFTINNESFTFSGQGVKWGVINGVYCLVHV